MLFFESSNNKHNAQTTILQRVASGDKSAAFDCVDVYGGMIWALARKSVVQTSEVESVVREIFADIWENADCCDLSISEEENWIALIAQKRLDKNAAYKH